MFYLGERLKQYRTKNHRGSAESFADRINISPAQLSKYENNKQHIPLTIVMDITIKYKDTSLYTRWMDALNCYVFECIKKNIS